MPTASECRDRKEWLRGALTRFEAPLVRYACRLVGDIERARDVVQDTFLRLCRETPSPGEDRLAAWLFTVCRNRAIDVRKKEARMKPLSDEHAEACTSRERGQLDVLESREEAGKATALLAGLPQNQQEVIRLKLQNDLSYREISEITGLSESNVGFLIHSGIKTIRTRFAVGDSARVK